MEPDSQSNDQSTSDDRYYIDHSDEDHTSEGENSATSPIAPRFRKETQRGVKRHLDIGKYRAESNRKKLVCLLNT